ncbi:hypothetical protein ANCCEY_07764 [Ancylostoma ceylanicum]|uniref:MGAT4 A/B/C C-terminal domain-containing protein n=1 Tax=Ancylostoma ceylanicum TaxID=53326 RepID=A0A0D6LPK3_9BILA|nr:hypothetical protein ANCCEY_07764 [Ancylostoma ceylanicum]
MTYAIALYYRFKPVDWILEDVLRSRYCSFDKSLKDCIQGERRNPPATVVTSMAVYKNHDAQTAYKNNVAMWLINPRIGDYISIMFNTEANITGVMFLSGVPPAPKDMFGPETFVSVFDSARREISLGQFSRKGDFVFRSNGMVATELRIKITANISHWITIDHIIIDVESTADHHDKNATTLRSP